MYLLLTTLSISTVQIPAVILRYLPFSKLIENDQKKKLFFYYGICFILQNIFVYFLLQRIFSDITPLTYKRLLFFLSISYVLLNVIVIKKVFFKHIFIYGMQGGYSLFIHSIVALFVGSFGSKLPIYLQLGMQTLLYIILFSIVTIPLWQIIKKSIVFNSSITNEYYWNIIWLIPALAIYGDAIVTMNHSWINSFPQILSRIMTAISLLVSWKWITLDLKSLENIFYLKNINRILYLQSEGIIAQANLLKESEKHIKICKHDMRHNLGIIKSLLNENKIDEVTSYIDHLDSNLKITNPIVYCENTIINSVFLVYMAKCNDKNIKVISELNIPEEISLKSNDLAILIANIFENAINASYKEDSDKREIQISARIYDNNLAIAIKNYFTGEVIFDKNGFPITNELNHGIGIQSVLSIVDKYKAYANCSYENNCFTMTFLFTDL